MSMASVDVETMSDVELAAIWIALKRGTPLHFASYLRPYDVMLYPDMPEFGVHCGARAYDGFVRALDWDRLVDLARD